MTLEDNILILVPEDDEIDLVAYFQEQLEDDLASAMDYSVSEFDDRAQIDNVEIIDVTVRGNIIDVTYEIEFSAYYGCSDMDYSATDERIIHGRRVGDVWAFPKNVHIPPRSTHDEL